MGICFMDLTFYMRAVVLSRKHILIESESCEMRTLCGFLHASDCQNPMRVSGCGLWFGFLLVLAAQPGEIIGCDTACERMQGKRRRLA